MFKRILVANRGEIALADHPRLPRDGRRKAVDGLFATPIAMPRTSTLADEAHLHRPGASPDSYLNIARIISAAEIARRTGDPSGLRLSRRKRPFRRGLPKLRDRVHRPDARGHGRGRATRSRASGQTEGERPHGARAPKALDRRPEDGVRRIADQIGFPVIIKAAAGGGGRGMRVAHNDVALSRRPAGPGRSRRRVRQSSRLPRKIRREPAARRSADPGRHSRQRDPPLGARLLDAAAAPETDRGVPRACFAAQAAREDVRCRGRRLQAAGYTNAGTVEFIVDEGSSTSSR